MTIDQAHQLQDGTVLETDVCVIGSGAAGITIGHELDGATFRVLILEAGGAKRDLASERELFGIVHHGVPQRNPEPPRARMFGGSTNLWYGRIAALDPIDYQHRPWVPHSGWPISADEMNPWLARAAELLDVPRFDRMDVGAWDPNQTIDAFQTGSGLELGVFLWSDSVILARRYQPHLERSRNVTVMLDATAVELITDEQSSVVERLVVARPDGARFTVRARVVVLAAGGLENPRLLLASRSRSDAGIGNDRDLVGRYYMDHPRGEGMAIADLEGISTSGVEPLALLAERPPQETARAQLRVKFSAQRQRDDGLLNHALHGHLVSAGQASPGFQSAKRITQGLRGKATPDASWSREVATVVRHAPSLVALAARKATRRDRPSQFVFVDQMEQEPDPASRVTVDHRHCDRLGLPQLEVDWRIGEATYRSQRRMHELMGAALRDVGISFESQLLAQPAVAPELWDMKHPSGTTRMATSPTHGVVGPDGQVHGVRNLFVAGSSVFPTVGHANPTLTIVALAARLADSLGRLLRGGHL